MSPKKRVARKRGAVARGEKVQVTLATVDGPKTVDGEAFTFAPGLVIHHRLEWTSRRTPLWNITHGKSGKAAFTAKRRIDAIRVLRAVGKLIDWTQDARAVMRQSQARPGGIRAVGKKAGAL